VFIFYRAVITICTAKFNIKKFYARSGVCIYVFCMDVRAGKDYLLFSIHGLVGIKRCVYCAKGVEYFRCKFRLNCVGVFLGQVFSVNLLSTFRRIMRRPFIVGHCHFLSSSILYLLIFLSLHYNLSY
jgi:hypothetical protein